MPIASIPSAFSVAHFGFRRKPFQGTGLDFLRVYPDYEAAYTRLLDGIRLNQGLILLTGETGTGKTLLLGNLVHDPTIAFDCILCQAPRDFDEVLSTICTGLDLTVAEPEISYKIKALKEYMSTAASADNGLVLGIDDADEMNEATMRNVLDMSHFAGRDGRSMNIVLAGLPQLNEHMAHIYGTINNPELPISTPVFQNVVVIYLNPLDDDQAQAFIQEQLRIAGGQDERLFPKEVLTGIIGYARGIPQLLNALCDRSLSIAEDCGQLQVSMEVLEQAAVELKLRVPEPGAVPKPTPKTAQRLRASAADPIPRLVEQRSEKRFPTLSKRVGLMLSLLVVIASVGGYVLYDRIAPNPPASVPETQSTISTVEKPAPVAVQPTPTETEPVATKPVPTAAKPAPVAVKPNSTTAKPGASVVTKPAPVIPPASVSVELSEQRRNTDYMLKGHQMLDLGDVASARQFYEVAAKAGNVSAATAVGKTYDPVALRQYGLESELYEDPVKAAQWYSQAFEAGDVEANDRLAGLRHWLTTSPDIGQSELETLQRLLRNRGYE